MAEWPVGVLVPIMDARRQRAEEIARRYIGVDHLLKDLGSGAEGFVFPSPHATAVKVFTYPEKFERELAAYQRLRERGVSEILGFAVPRLVAYSRDLLVIEMTIVQPPFILDFAESRLDVPLDFPEGEDEWWERVAALFGERFPIVRDLYGALVARCGIYYYDLAPRNIHFGDV